jgi:hypothetical protein
MSFLCQWCLCVSSFQLQESVVLMLWCQSELLGTVRNHILEGVDSVDDPEKLSFVGNETLVSSLFV